MDVENHSLQDLSHIRQMMERSSKFVSLSGLSGISAGIISLAGAFLAYKKLDSYYIDFTNTGYTNVAFQKLKADLLIIAGVVLILALFFAFFFTNRRAKSSNTSIWNATSRRLLVNMAIPLLTGGLFILSMLSYDQWQFVASLTLIFYGLALVNASKYTLTDIRYLGYCEIVLGLINTQFVHYGLYFWATGFGILHIVYGFVMWIRYERNTQ